MIREVSILCYMYNRYKNGLCLIFLLKNIQTIASPNVHATVETIYCFTFYTFSYIITLDAGMCMLDTNVSRCPALFFLYIVVKFLLLYFEFFPYKRKKDQYYKHHELHSYCESRDLPQALQQFFIIAHSSKIRTLCNTRSKKS